jgi:hypothetical protein
MISSKLPVLHQMWRLQIINPNQIITYLEYLGFELILLTLGGISVISKDKKTTYSYGE